MPRPFRALGAALFLLPFLPVVSAQTPPTVLDTGLAVDPTWGGPPPFLAGSGFAVFAAAESGSLGGDRTGDLDLADHVPFVVPLDR